MKKVLTLARFTCIGLAALIFLSAVASFIRLAIPESMFLLVASVYFLFVSEGFREAASK